MELLDFESKIEKVKDALILDKWEESNTNTVTDYIRFFIGRNAALEFEREFLKSDYCDGYDNKINNVYDDIKLIDSFIKWSKGYYHYETY